MFFYHIPPTVLADFNIYLLGEKNDISKKKRKLTLGFAFYFAYLAFIFSIFRFYFLFSLPSSFLKFYHSKNSVFKRD